MSLLLETTLGDLVIDLDVKGSPELCKNVLKLAKARYYTSTLIYNVQPNRFFQAGDPRGNGSGGACIYGLLDADSSKHVTQSKRRFLKSFMGRELTPQECREKGRVVATEMNGIPDTIGSQFLITIDEGMDKALDGFQNLSNNDVLDQQQRDRNRSPQSFRSIGQVVEDENHVLDQIAKSYCDADGRPYADIRIIRALVIDDPFKDPPGMDQLLKDRGVVLANHEDGHSGGDNFVDKVIASPEYERPSEETVEMRIQADQIDLEMGEEDIEKQRQQEEELLQREDKSRAVVLEMLGDLPSADIKAPENVLFVCKLNPVTEDEDLELIFSRFDEKVKAEIIRDHESGSSLQYAFVEFTTKEQAAEAYFKMNNALVDDRRIKVDFSQSVAKVWDRFNQREKGRGRNGGQKNMPRDPFHYKPHGNRQQSTQQKHRGTHHVHHHREHRTEPRNYKGHGPSHSGREHDDHCRHKDYGEDRHQHGFDRHASRHLPRDRNDDYQRRRGEEGRHHSKEEYRHGHGNLNTQSKDDKDDFGRRRRSPSPQGHRRHRSKDRDDRSASPSSASDDSRRHRRRHHRRRSRSRSRSRDRKEKKHKRKRERRDESRERKQKKHKKGRDKERGERKRRRSRDDDSSSASSKYS